MCVRLMQIRKFYLISGDHVVVWKKARILEPVVISSLLLLSLDFLICQMGIISIHLRGLLKTIQVKYFRHRGLSVSSLAQMREPVKGLRLGGW